jgi:integrase
MVRLFSKHQKNHKAGSTNRVIILCRYVFNCAIRWEVAGATKNPTSNIDLYPENNKIERYLTDDESKRLFVELENSPNKQLKFIVAVLLLTGARKREVLDAKWSDFDLQNRVWTIRFNKSGRARHIPISDGLITILGQLPRFKDCDWLLPNPKTKQPYVQLFTAWNTARQKAGLPDVRIHDLRHSFASYLVNSGRSLYEVQKILGHTEITTTQRYAHLSHDSLMSAVDAASKSVPLLASMPRSTSSLSLLAVQQ